MVQVAGTSCRRLKMTVPPHPVSLPAPSSECGVEVVKSGPGKEERWGEGIFKISLSSLCLTLMKLVICLWLCCFVLN